MNRTVKREKGNQIVHSIVRQTDLCYCAAVCSGRHENMLRTGEALNITG